MATPFSQIYDKAIFKFSDPDFMEKDIEKREAILEKFLISAQVDFQDTCKVDLADRDMENKQYNNDLSDEIQEILALGIAFHWLDSKTRRSELLRNLIYKKDYTTYSPANLLREVRALRDEIRREYFSRIREYGYKYSDIDKLKA